MISIVFFFSFLYFLAAFFFFLAPAAGAAAAFSAACLALRTRTTIFCSSIKNARMILSLTAAAQRLPPYALDTRLCLFGMFFNAVGRAGLMPCSLTPVSPHRGILAAFFWYK